MADEAEEMSQLETKAEPSRKQTTSSKMSPESRLILYTGTIYAPDPYGNVNVTVPDLCNTISTMWNENLFRMAEPVIEYKESPWTNFDQAALIQMLMIIACVHNEVFSPASTQRRGITSLYTPLMRRFGRLTLLPEEVRMIESFCTNEISDTHGTPAILMAKLPDTPGVDKTDHTGYTINDTAIYYIIPFYVLFDHMLHNARANQLSFLLPPVVPNRYVTSWFMRSHATTGFNKIQKSAISTLAPANYILNPNLPGLTDTWEYFVEPRDNVHAFAWLNGLMTRRNAFLTRVKATPSSYTLDTLLRKSAKPESGTTVFDLAMLQIPRDIPAAQVGANRPDVTDIRIWYEAASVLKLADQEVAEATIRAYNTIYGNRASPGVMIGNIADPPAADPIRRYDTTNPNRYPVPSWAGPIMIGSLFSAPLTGVKVTYDRAQVGAHYSL